MKSDSKGFTLAELLVVTAIVLLMGALAIPSWRRGQGSLRLAAETHLMSQRAREAIEYALSGQTATCPGNQTLKGYGFHASTTSPESYVLFGDCNGNKTYQQGSDAALKIYEFEEGVYIQRVSAGSFVSAVFVPPDPAVYLNPGSPADIRVTLALSADPQQTKDVVINAKGVIEIQ